jgi:hypothetical protein
LVHKVNPFRPLSCNGLLLKIAVITLITAMIVMFQKVGVLPVGGKLQGGQIVSSVIFIKYLSATKDTWPFSLQTLLNFVIEQSA